MRKKTISDLKRQARALLSSNYKLPVLATVFVGLFNYALSAILSAVFPADSETFNQWLYLACALLCNMIYYIFFSGAMRLYLKLIRRQKFRLSELFFFFVNHPEPIAIYSILQFFIREAMRYVIEGYFAGHTNDISAVSIYMLLAVGALIWLQLCLALVLFLYCDAPWKNTLQLIMESWKTMRGHKNRIFCLNLSFIWIDLLGLFSFGIGFLFIRPYQYTSQALFYQELIPDADAKEFN